MHYPLQAIALLAPRVYFLILFIFEIYFNLISYVIGILWRGFATATRENKYPLHVACGSGNLATVKELIKAGHKINVATTDKNLTPLYVACMKGHADIVEQLVKAGAKMEICTNNIRPIHVAVRNNHANVVRKLVELGDDVNAKTTDTKGLTPLHIAAQYGCLEVLKELVKLGAQLSIREKEMNSTPLLHAVVHNQPESIKVLVGLGADIKKESDSSALDKRAIQISAAAGATKSIEALVKLGADPNDMSEKRPLPLVAAILGTKPKKEIFSKLVELGAKIDMKFQKRSTLHWLLGSDLPTNALECLQELIRLGANVNEREEREAAEYPIHMAVRHGNPEILEVLLKAGANLEVLNKKNTTPLLKAAQLAHVHLGKMLIGAGANTNIFKGFLVDCINKDKVLQLKGAVEMGAKINDYEMSLLFLAIQLKNPAMVKCLVELGADVNAKMKRGNLTVLDMACDEPNAKETLEMVKILLSNGATTKYPAELIETVEPSNKELAKLLRSKLKTK